MKTIKLTSAQALVKYFANQYIDIDGMEVQIFAGIFAIFGHGNVAGLGEALYHAQDSIPTYRAHNEQGMAHAAIAYAKANKRQRMMACTTSVGPGATNMVTAAALAHANRLPMLLVPGDTFANRIPDPVLQQVEHFGDPTMSVNDCFKPVSRYFDRIARPEQLINSLPVAMDTLLDPINCGPVTIAFPQDVQAEAYDYPASFFAKKVHRIRQQPAEVQELEDAITLIKQAERPLIIAGGGVLYSGASEVLSDFAQTHGIPVCETQAGKGALNWEHPCAVGGIGVTGSAAANSLALESDLILSVGSRLQDFTTQSRTIFNSKKLLQINVAGFDANKHGAIPLRGDAKTVLLQLSDRLSAWKSSEQWLPQAQTLNKVWQEKYDQVTSEVSSNKPSDANVLGTIKQYSHNSDVVVCAAGGLPGELHKLWRAEGPNTYHVEYGFSCMGYEVAGGLGVKMANPEREVFVLVGDGSYMMMNSELSTSVMLEQKIIVVLLDNRGFGCINRLQIGTGNQPFNNLLQDCAGNPEAMQLDFAAHAKAMGANAEKVANLDELGQALGRARASDKSYLICIDTDPLISTDNGTWWDVAVPQVSQAQGVNQAHKDYVKGKQQQPY
jgi:3D-(3,5/4)-trihydroxycyclohexane-1,2-dione acylhydrolase (decyclizing)